MAMKNVALLLGIMCCSHLASAQLGFKSLGLSGGLSTANSKLFTLSYQGAGEKKLHLGILLQGLLYSDYDHHRYSWSSQKTYVSAGLFGSYTLVSTRNFMQSFKFGAAAGSDNSRFVWYPFTGFEQDFFIAPKTQFFIGEQVLYLFVKENAYQWQPSLQLGLKFSL